MLGPLLCPILVLLELFLHPYWLSSTDFDLVNTVSDEFKILQEYLIKSHGHTHHLSFKVRVYSPLSSTYSKTGFPGPRHLPYRAQRRRRALPAVSIRKNQSQRPPPPLARLPSYQLRWYSLARPSHRPSRSSRKWLRFWKRGVPSKYTLDTKLFPNDQCRRTNCFNAIQPFPRPTSPPNQPTTANPTPPPTPVSSSSAKSSSANLCSSSKSAAPTPRSWPNSRDASQLGARAPRRLWGGKMPVA